MRAVNFGLIAVLSRIAVIGATSGSNDGLAEAITRRQSYVPYAVMAHGGSDLIEKSSSSLNCAELLLSVDESCGGNNPSVECPQKCEAFTQAGCSPLPSSCNSSI